LGVFNILLRSSPHVVGAYTLKRKTPSAKNIWILFEAEVTAAYYNYITASSNTRLIAKASLIPSVSSIRGLFLRALAIHT
jgi:hypothetical protein